MGVKLGVDIAGYCVDVGLEGEAVPNLLSEVGDGGRGGRHCFFRAEVSDGYTHFF
jgi:hypothetical protein